MTSSRTRRPRGRAALLTTAALAAAGLTAAGVAATRHGGVTLAADAGSAGSVTAAFTTASSWDGGYTGRYTLTNTGSGTAHGWTLTFDLPSGASLGSLWNGVRGGDARHVQVTNESWNAGIAPGASRTVGFTVTLGDDQPASAGTPVSCRINGSPCAAGGAPAPAPSATATTKPPAPAPTPTPTATPTSGTPAASAGGFAPYVDVGLYPPYDLTGNAAKTGVKNYTLAFIVSGGGCVPKWGGAQGLGDNAVAGRIGALRAAGGDVRVSFGGANGTELGRACGSAAQLASAYKQVIDAFKLTKVDFDVEGAAIADTAANDRRAQAIATLQKQLPGLDVSFTLPVLPSGLTPDGVNLLTDAKRAGVAISAVNIMAMDYGDGQAPNPSGKMGDYAIQAATSTEAQVRSALGLSSAWSHLAITPMIGVNDTNTEVFTVADARKVAAFAASRHLAWLSMWSATRDKPCPGGPKTWADATCSSIDQAAGDFAKAFG